jgi:DNA mismatch endonuclease, patch repair protein
LAERLTKQQRSRLMSRVRTRDTAPELTLRRALWAAGIRGWRLHPRDVPGRPDFVWKGRRIAVFVDGAFWHGHPNYYWGQSGDFWDSKIERNRARDAQVNAELAAEGWTVLRFWDFEVERDSSGCVARVNAVLNNM